MDQDEGPWVPSEYVMTDCYEQAASFPVPAGDYAGVLPEGFEVAPYSGGGSFGPTPTGGLRGELFVVASRCTDPNGTEFERAFTSIFVQPPQDLGNAEATFGHLLVLGYWTTSSTHFEVWDQWGLRPSLGNLSIGQTDTGAVRNGVAEFPSPGGVTLSSTVALAEESLPANTARFFVANETGPSAIADAVFGELSAYLGSDSVTGAPQDGIRAGPYDGVGFHAFGHSNHWTHVPLP